ncbi:MAG: hypothetical protein F6J95_031115 [Leptolyngbya sp. SIO1E4]|nr:hypothetical protein [Leptolyngbya sp. SIO1E4]
MEIQTIQGKSASILGLAEPGSLESSCVDLAWQAGINYFFAYGMSSDSPLLRDLRPLLQQQRESVIVATGGEQREIPQ